MQDHHGFGLAHIDAPPHWIEGSSMPTACPVLCVEMDLNRRQRQTGARESGNGPPPQFNQLSISKHLSRARVRNLPFTAGRSRPFCLVGISRASQ